MSTTQIRKHLHKYVDSLDTPFLQAVYGLIKAHVDENTLVGYTSKRKPITTHDLKVRVKVAQTRMDKGHYVSQEDVEKEAALW